MSQKKTNSYTAEFKEAAVKLAVESDQGDVMRRATQDKDA